LILQLFNKAVSTAEVM